MLKQILFTSLLLLVGAHSSIGQPVTATEPSQSDTPVAAQAKSQQTASHKLVFFLDPNGGPCIMQVNILDDMAPELQGKVDIQYVQTTVPTDRAYFYQYGIRALPTLLLADVNGKEIKRLPPGVKRSDDIRLLIQSIL